ncbi:hypothetical protein B296_00043717 [Ensete ventricosum]|uniref:DUF4228 domain-containing protein n=1 Tax=Ensete ventricosum TaxID=4639 RepID=A0A426YSJ1_ENSVE|nr:hypothetical protein B296_00043717 [Ensete ventricosum]
MGKGLLRTCFGPRSRGLVVKLVFWGGTATFFPEKKPAGEVMFRFPDRIVCPADSFFIGLPIPVLSAAEELLPGRTYFVLPADRFRLDQTLTVASLASLSPVPKKVSLAGDGQRPFAYVKGGDGRTLIKVLPEFISMVICSGEGGRGGDGGALCSTPELKRHYTQLVGSRGRRPWSPALERITERKSRSLSSPVKLLGLERRLC